MGDGAPVGWGGGTGREACAAVPCVAQPVHIHFPPHSSSIKGNMPAMGSQPWRRGIFPPFFPAPPAPRTCQLAQRAQTHRRRRRVCYEVACQGMQVRQQQCGSMQRLPAAGSALRKYPPLPPFPTQFSDFYGNQLDRNSVCYDDSASVVVMVSDVCPCWYPAVSCRGLGQAGEW